MNLRRVLGLVVAISLVVVVLIASPISFAQGANTCTATMREALTQTAVNCADMGTNSACYGFDEIESVLNGALNGDAFGEPGDTVNDLDVVTLRPAAISALEETWGVTVLNLQASLPSGFEEDVVVVGLGGAEIEAAVPLDAAFVPLDAPVTLTTAGTGELREATLTVPDEAETIGQVPAGTDLLADAVSENGEWVRVIHDEAPGWLSAEAFAATDLAALPVLGDGQLTALQSFYIRTGIENQTCAPASSWVFVQGPKQVPVDMIINDVTIRIESTIVLRTLEAGEPVGPQLQIFVLFGLARVNPDTDEEIVVPPGYTLLVDYGDEMISAGIEGDEDERSGPTRFGAPRIVTQQELNEVDVTTLLPPDLLNYPAPPPIIITPSGVGGPIIELIFEDPIAIVGVEELCEQGLIPVAICEVFGFTP